MDLATAALEVLRNLHPDRLVAVASDVSDLVTNQEAGYAATWREKKPDRIILNAARLVPVGPVAEIDLEDLKHLTNVNFFGLVHAGHFLNPQLCAS